MVLRAALVLAVLTIGCGHRHHHCHSFWEGRRPDGASAAAAGVIGLITLIGMATDAQVAAREPDPPRPLTRPLVGKVLLADGRSEVAGVTVTLRDPHDLVVLEAVTDARGWFRFPLPLPPSWYVLSVDDEAGRGQTRLWLHERRPAHLNVLLQPGSAPAAERQ